MNLRGFARNVFVGLAVLPFLASGATGTQPLGESDLFSDGLDDVLPNFGDELRILRHQLRSVFELEESPEAEGLRLEEAFEEVHYEADQGAQTAYERALTLVATNKDGMRANGCTVEDILRLSECKWINGRLQKLNTLYVSKLSASLRKLRMATMREARRQASSLEAKCVKRAYVKINGVDGPQPEFHPDRPGKPSHENEPIVPSRVDHPHLDYPGGPPSGPMTAEETEEERLIRLGELQPGELAERARMEKQVCDWVSRVRAALKSSDAPV
eukprot:INCI9306.2.p1 GENE.INCI9306.2~~INCI9306.2.p1  ORF type:complete len:272 (+),score=39.80 INCI9306.2:490-1305(+)